MLWVFEVCLTSPSAAGEIGKNIIMRKRGNYKEQPVRKRSLAEWPLLGSLYGNGVHREPGVIRAADYTLPIHLLEVISKPFLRHSSEKCLPHCWYTFIWSETEANLL